MASKKFDNIGGVVLKRIEDGKRCILDDDYLFYLREVDLC